ncbi:hypothetical protein ASE00_01950 [Sphingomonas sp. Root710]|uniref:hypothetical protein n=1 Tax=Sphingomonas sp. Root710 TaxID=1736594 RepID=UPI0006FD7668|nr:hypothetical protein [Sphingomonas sp. Root710]KRB85583.1 hypothetical protein ASE00_01950 [Sphingomonas sp. Root710]
MQTNDEDDALILEMDEPAARRGASRTSLYDRIIDFLGATKPLNLIAGICAIIGIVAYLAEVLR